MTKKIVATAFLITGLLAGAQAQQQPSPKPAPSPAVQTRAEHLTKQMARELRLNGYQTTKLGKINADKVAKMAAIEAQYAGNPKVIDEQCNGVCRERDRELQAVLSTDQYTDYYGRRSAYYKYDKDYAAQARDIRFVNSVQNPSPSAKGAVISPATTEPRSAASGGSR